MRESAPERPSVQGKTGGRGASGKGGLQQLPGEVLRGRNLVLLSKRAVDPSSWVLVPAVSAAAWSLQAGSVLSAGCPLPWHPAPVSPAVFAHCTYTKYRLVLGKAEFP